MLSDIVSQMLEPRTTGIAVPAPPLSFPFLRILSLDQRLLCHADMMSLDQQATLRTIPERVSIESVALFHN